MMLDNQGFIWLGVVCVEGKGMSICVIHQDMNFVFLHSSLPHPPQKNSQALVVGAWTSHPRK